MKISGVRDGFLDRFNPVFDGRLRYVLLSAEGALDRSLGCSEAEPQESAMSRGQALKDRRRGGRFLYLASQVNIEFCKYFGIADVSPFSFDLYCLHFLALSGGRANRVG